MTYIVLTPKEQSTLPSSDEEVKDLDFESNIKLFYNVSNEMDFQELLKIEGDPKARKLSSGSDEGFDCLDHDFFNVELRSLLNMHKQTE